MFEEALARFQQLYQGDHPNIAISLNNLANGLRGLRGLGEPERARDLDEQALAMRQRLYDGDHPDIAASLHNLAEAARQGSGLLGSWDRDRRARRSVTSRRTVVQRVSAHAVAAASVIPMDAPPAVTSQVRTPLDEATDRRDCPEAAATRPRPFDRIKGRDPGSGRAGARAGPGGSGRSSPTGGLPPLVGPGPAERRDPRGRRWRDHAAGGAVLSL